MQDPGFAGYPCPYIPIYTIVIFSKAHSIALLTNFHIKEMFLMQSFSSECNEIFLGLATCILGNIRKNLLAVRPDACFISNVSEI